MGSSQSSPVETIPAHVTDRVNSAAGDKKMFAIKLKEVTAIAATITQDVKLFTNIGKYNLSHATELFDLVDVIELSPTITDEDITRCIILHDLVLGNMISVLQDALKFWTNPNYKPIPGTVGYNSGDKKPYIGLIGKYLRDMTASNYSMCYKPEHYMELMLLHPDIEPLQ